MRLFTLVIMQSARLAARCMSEARVRAIFPQSPDCVCHWTVEVKCPQNITFGRRVIIGPHCTLGAFAPIYLGDDVHLSKGVTLETGNLDISQPLPFPHNGSPISVHRGVWIGTGAIVLKGVTIGANSIIGAGVIVRKDVPADSIVSTEPARVKVRQASFKPARDSAHAHQMGLGNGR
jgi:acetyltransferase-like isoleucine patch superfamily enzyme